MAWRDTRGNRAHLLLSMSALAVGIAALVAIHGFGRQLDLTIQQQTRLLLGADFSIRSLQPFSREVEDFLATLPGDSVREVRFFSMSVMESSGETQLSQIRALDGPFPFYGTMKTTPPDAALAFLDDPRLALVEESLMIQTGATIGDTIRLGAERFTIGGVLLDVSGELPATSSFIGPRIYIAAAALEATELLGDESLARYFMHGRLPPDQSAESLLRQHRATLAELRLEMETAEQRQAILGNLLDQLHLYLTIGALTAVVLGGIGCAGSIQLYARRKREIVATLRCMGAPTLPTFCIYILQAVAAAFIGGCIGAVAGTALQRVIPRIVADFLPIEIEMAPSIGSLLTSVLLGMGISFAFTAWPLAGLRLVPPLEAFRPRTTPVFRDPVQWFIGLLLWTSLTLFCIRQTGSVLHGLIFSFALTVVFGLLTASAKLLMRVARVTVGSRGPFTWRQGIASIHRPFNQTTLLLLSLGLGAFLLSTLALTQSNLLRQFRGEPDSDQPNVIFFNIQPDQKEAVLELIQSAEVRLDEVTPIVTMRLESVNGLTVAQLRDDPSRDIPHWVLFREYRSTYRETLLARDQIIAGAWEDYSGRGPIPISIEAGLADYLGIGLNDRLVFNLQGVRLDSIVRSIRKVDWREMRTNFFVIFPSRVLEEAPHSFAIVTAIPSADTTARLQSAVISRYANISAVDLRMLLSSINEVVDQAAFAIRFMALFSVLTGGLVLGATVVAGRYDRAAETSLLRTLGASQKHLNQIMSAEYAILGGIASISGLALAIAASWAASRWLFSMPFQLTWGVVLLMPSAITALTLLLGRALTHWAARTR